jgi:hypothetical protein
VHFPEPIVRSGEFGALGGRLGVGVDLTQGKMPENEIQVLVELLLHHIDNRMSEAARITGLPFRSLRESHWSGVTRSLKSGAMVPAARIFWGIVFSSCRVLAVRTETHNASPL